jgi:hypothetical protein
MSDSPDGLWTRLLAAKRLDFGGLDDFAELVAPGVPLIGNHGSDIGVATTVHRNAAIAVPALP